MALAPTLDFLHRDADLDQGLQHSHELAQWFGTDYYYPIPEFSADQQFALDCELLLGQVEEASALGREAEPVVIGPLTFLWLGQTKDGSFDKLELLDQLLPVYGELLRRLAGKGVEWVQIDEPILTLDLPQCWKNAFERAYHILQYSPLKKLVATYSGGLKDNLGLAISLPVDGLHIDLVQAPGQLATVLDRLPNYKVLSLGTYSPGQGEGPEMAALLRQAAQWIAPGRLWLNPDCGPIPVYSSLKTASSRNERVH